MIMDAGSPNQQLIASCCSYFDCYLKICSNRFRACQITLILVEILSVYLPTCPQDLAEVRLCPPPSTSKAHRPSSYVLLEEKGKKHLPSLPPHLKRY